MPTHLNYSTAQYVSYFWHSKQFELLEPKRQINWSRPWPSLGASPLHCKTWGRRTTEGFLGLGSVDHFPKGAHVWKAFWRWLLPTFWFTWHCASPVFGVDLHFKLHQLFTIIYIFEFLSLPPRLLEFVSRFLWVERAAMFLVVDSRLQTKTVTRWKPYDPFGDIRRTHHGSKWHHWIPIIIVVIDLSNECFFGMRVISPVSNKQTIQPKSCVYIYIYITMTIPLSLSIASIAFYNYEKGEWKQPLILSFKY